MSSSVCIVGAGAAGLAAAYALRRSEYAVTVVEKSRGLSGRAATRWRDAPGPNGDSFRWRYDHGAQYLSPEPGSPAARLIQEELDAAGLVSIEGAVVPFDNGGTLRPDRVRGDSSLRLTYRDGIADLGRRLVAATPGLDIQRQTRASALRREQGGWYVETEAPNGPGTLGPFDAVLLTPPAPQSAELLTASAFDDALRGRLVDALETGTYRSQFTVVFAFDHPIGRPDAYALVNAPAEADPSHGIAWLAFESDKPNRAPEGATLLLAQMSDAWTEAHYDDERVTVVDEAARAVSDLLGALPAPSWTDTQRWRYSLPNAGVDESVLEEAAAHGLFFAGDYTAGKGRVHLALEEGLGAAARIEAALVEGR